MADEVRYEIRANAARLTIDREERRNALSPSVIAGLVDHLASAAKDQSVRVVVITGAGDRAFCAGGDIGGFQQAAQDQDVESAPSAISRLLDALWWHPKPTLARVNGKALGGGFGLLLACDLVRRREGERQRPRRKRLLRHRTNADGGPGRCPRAPAQSGYQPSGWTKSSLVLLAEPVKRITKRHLSSSLFPVFLLLFVLQGAAYPRPQRLAGPNTIQGRGGRLRDAGRTPAAERLQ